jgi:hypothetical protein
VLEKIHLGARALETKTDYEEITAVICAHNLLEILLRDETMRWRVSQAQHKAVLGIKVYMLRI